MRKRNTEYNKAWAFHDSNPMFFDMLLDDTWLCEDEITIEETQAVWNFYNKQGLTNISVSDFDNVQPVSFKDITEFWNNEILRIHEKSVVKNND